MALYSHDALGLGHVRRNLAIAGALSDARPDAAILLLAGAAQAHAFPAPPGVDFLTLPALRKNAAGGYAPRSLAAPLRQVLALRSATLTAALDAFAPDLLVVDKLPRGVLGELEPALHALRERGSTRIVLGLRDILDEPAVARRQWHEDRGWATVARLYDAVWVYGDRRVNDVAAECDVPAALAGRVQYTGYLAPRPRPRRPGPHALCLVGGGEDGHALATAFLAAPLPKGWSGTVVTGPFMPALQRRQLERQAAAGAGAHQVVGFVDDVGPLLAQAGAVVAMAGYNTAVELLAAGVPALLVPRERPRAEQLVRARHLSRLGLARMLRQAEATPAAIGRWLAAPAPPAPGVVDLDGLGRLPLLVDGLLGAATAEVLHAVG